MYHSRERRKIYESCKTLNVYASRIKGWAGVKLREIIPSTRHYILCTISLSACNGYTVWDLGELRCAKSNEKLTSTVSWIHSRVIPWAVLKCHTVGRRCARARRFSASLHPVRAFRSRRRLLAGSLPHGLKMEIDRTLASYRLYTYIYFFYVLKAKRAKPRIWKMKDAVGISRERERQDTCTALWNRRSPYIYIVK